MIQKLINCGASQQQQQKKRCSVSARQVSWLHRGMREVVPVKYQRGNFLSLPNTWHFLFCRKRMLLRNPRHRWWAVGWESRGSLPPQTLMRRQSSCRLRFLCQRADRLAWELVSKERQQHLRSNTAQLNKGVGYLSSRFFQEVQQPRYLIRSPLCHSPLPSSSN